MTQTGEGPLTIDQVAACGARDAIALMTEGQSLTYSDLEHRVGTLAGTLLDRGLKPGDRVASWLPKGVMSCLLPLATARAGLVHVPVNPQLRRAQVRHILEDSGAALLVALPSLARSLDSGDVPDTCLLCDPADLAETSRVVPASPAQVDDPVAILYTSGSTGRAKGVTLSHRNLWMGAQSVAGYLGLKTDDRVLAVLPLSFDYGQNQLFSAWFAGATVVTLDYLLPRDVYKAIDAHRITTLAGVPPLFAQLVDVTWKGEPLSTLRRVTNSGGALTPALIDRIRAALNPGQIYAMYGLTEAFRSTWLKPDLLDRFPTSIGTAIPHAEVMLVRPDGTLAGEGETGELVHAGPLVSLGYWNNPEATAARFRAAPAGSAYGGTAVWSGDIVRQSGGLLYFVGRHDEMIKTSGFRVSPGEIEEAALSDGSVGDAAAFGVPDVRLGQRILLAVRFAEPSSDRLPALEARLARDLPTYMRPAHIYVYDALPRSPNGKIDRPALKAELARRDTEARDAGHA